MRWDQIGGGRMELLMENILRKKKIYDKPEWEGQLMCS